MFLSEHLLISYICMYVCIFMLRICVGSLDFELKQEPELFFHKEKFSQKLGILIFLLEKFEKSLIREASRPGPLLLLLILKLLWQELT